MKRILFVAYKKYYLDPRIVRERNALLERGYHIDHICLTPIDNFEANVDPARETLYLFPLKKHRGSRLMYLFEQAAFFFYALFASTMLFFKYRYRVIQVFVMPEVLVLTTIIPRLLGAKILMDWEDPSVEVFKSKFSGRFDGVFVAGLRFFEWISIRFASRIITPNIGFKDAFVARGIPASKIDIVMNAPDPGLFNDPGLAGGARDMSAPFILLFNGANLRRHGTHLVIQALALLPDIRSGIELIVYNTGRNPYSVECMDLAEKLSVADSVCFTATVPIDRMPPIIAHASVGVIPNLDTPFTRINFPQRIMEFAYYGIPVIASRLEGIVDYMPDDSICYFAPDDVNELAGRIRFLYENEAERLAIGERARVVCGRLGWKEDYLDAVEGLYGA